MGKNMSQASLVFEREMMLAAFDVAQTGLCVADHKGEIIVVNPRFAAKLGLSQLEIIGKSWRTLLTTAMNLPEAEALFSVEYSEVSAVGVLDKSPKNRRVLLFKANTLVHKDGGQYRIVACTDITDERHAQEQLGLWRRQIESMNAGVVISDAQQPDMPIVYCNSKFQELTGYTAAEIMGRNCRFLQAEDRQQPAIQEIREAIQARRNCYVVLKNYKKDGTLFLNELFMSPVFDQAGKLTHFIAVQNDISSKKPNIQPFDSLPSK
jgi:PAS domain S-box-containing protein